MTTSLSSDFDMCLLYSFYCMALWSVFYNLFVFLLLSIHVAMVTIFDHFEIGSCVVTKWLFSHTVKYITFPKMLNESRWLL